MVRFWRQITTAPRQQLQWKHGKIQLQLGVKPLLWPRLMSSYFRWTGYWGFWRSGVNQLISSFSDGKMMTWKILDMDPPSPDTLACHPLRILKYFLQLETLSLRVIRVLSRTKPNFWAVWVNLTQNWPPTFGISTWGLPNSIISFVTLIFISKVEFRHSINFQT